MTAQPEDNRLPIPLYHGTSSLFLDNIIKYGLGGYNPIVAWKVLELAKDIYPLVEEYFFESDLKLRVANFRNMVQQRSGTFNWQHGDTYLSSSRSTAGNYVVDSRYGSELLTYTLDFFAALLRLRVEGLNDLCLKRYPKLFNLLDVSPVPLLVQVDNLTIEDLVAENGSDARERLGYIRERITDSPGSADMSLQQINFRLRRPVPAKNLKLWSIDVKKWDFFNPEKSLAALPPTVTF